MNIKKMFLTAAMMLFMVFAISGLAENTYAYWASNVAPPTASDTSGTIGIGAWAVIPQWDPAGTYLIGDRVVNNGSIYEAKKDNPTKEPGVDSGWSSQWTLIGPA
jgi:hypothetical protein